MKSQIISYLLILLSFPIIAQNASGDTNKIEPWLGEFIGTLHIYSSSKDPATIPMKIKNFATDTSGLYGWYLIYGVDEESGTRPYYLKEIDMDKGHYVVDEKNSILLDTYMIGNKMISDFEVEGSTITSIYTLVDENTLTFEIIAGNSDAPHITGGKDDISAVSAYLIKGYHYAELKRISEPDK